MKFALGFSNWPSVFLVAPFRRMTVAGLYTTMHRSTNCHQESPNYDEPVHSILCCICFFKSRDIPYPPAAAALCDSSLPNRCIRVLGFWRLKRRLRRILIFSPQNCTRIMCFYKPRTSAASESEFDHANKILCLKVGVPVYTVSRLSKCQG